MITLKVDEAYAFDYLAILEIKNKLYPSPQQNAVWLMCKEHLIQKLNNFIDIYNSLEYQELLNSNQITFELIDRLRNGENITAKEIDDANMNRFYKKQNLQNKFFNNSLTEEKIPGNPE